MFVVVAAASTYIIKLFRRFESCKERHVNPRFFTLLVKLITHARHWLAACLSVSQATVSCLCLLPWSHTYLHLSLYFEFLKKYLICDSNNGKKTGCPIKMYRSSKLIQINNIVYVRILFCNEIIDLVQQQRHEESLTLYDEKWWHVILLLWQEADELAFTNIPWSASKFWNANKQIKCINK